MRIITKCILLLLMLVILFHIHRIQQMQYSLNLMDRSNRLWNYFRSIVLLSNAQASEYNTLKKKSNWYPLSPHPTGGFTEANCVVHQGNVWVLSGYKCRGILKNIETNRSYTNVNLYNYKTNRWLSGPRFSYVLHHTFSSAFSVGHRVVTIGGLRQSFDDALKSVEPHTFLVELDTREIQIPYENSGTDESKWRPAVIPYSLQTRISKLNGSGMSTCTQLPTLNRKYYCYLDSAKDFIDDIPRFISIKFKTDLDAMNTPVNESVIEEIEELAVIANVRYSHTVLVVDLYRNEIIMLPGRDSESKKPNRYPYSFSIEKNVWRRRDEIKLPYSFEVYESRSFIQLSYNANDDFSLCWLLGGQDVRKRIVTHDIVLLKLFKDPSQNDGRILSFYDVFPVDLLPEHLHSGCITKVPISKQRQLYKNRTLLVLGGSNNVGPFCRTAVHEWEPPSNLILTTLQPNTDLKPSCYQLQSYTVEYAQLGDFNITSQVQSMLTNKTIRAPDYFISTENCHQFAISPQLRRDVCKRDLSVIMFDHRLNRQYTVTCSYPNICRLIYC